jgi:hypothetical protein
MTIDMSASRARTCYIIDSDTDTDTERFVVVRKRRRSEFLFCGLNLC